MPSIDQYFTPDMAMRANIAIKADQLRRSAKLKRLSPDASPYTNIMSGSLDFEEGDPECIEDFVGKAEALVVQRGMPNTSYAAYVSAALARILP